MKHSTEINFSRAVLILLVVLVHIVHFGTTYPAVKEAILAFMMPAFLFITGYLANVDNLQKPSDDMFCKFSYLISLW